MEANLKTEKITHRLPTIQFTDKAIENLRWNKGTEKRQRISIKFKNGPKGISLRWSPRTNKKVFQLIFRFEGKTIFHDCGEYTPGVFTCSALQEYLLKLNAKHNSIKLAYPTEANEVFAKFPRNMIEHLNSEGYKMNEDELDGKAARLVAAWNTQESDVDQLLETLKKSY